MKIESTLFATQIFNEIQKKINIKSRVILNAENKNIFIGICFNEYEFSKKEENFILKNIKKMDKKFERNHFIINKHMIVFQGIEKEVMED